MSRSVLLLEGTSPSGQSQLRHILQSHAPCEWRTWTSVSWQSLEGEQHLLIVARVEPESVHKAVEFFESLQNAALSAPVLAILPDPSDPCFLQTVAEMTDDFMFWPIREEEFNLRLTRILESRSCVEILQSEMALANLVGKDPSFVRAIEQVKLFTRSNAPVLITGETGTGKELFAHAIHSLSERRNGPFIPIDCSALPEHLAESELFGHCRGAFTDAHTDRKGLAAMAADGTLFLDEIDSLSLASQAKLLRFLQEGMYRPLGTDRFMRANVRVVAASNLSIEERVRDHRFRNDLYFRVNVLRLHLPPLRDRRGDIPLLAKHCMDRQPNPSRKAISAAAVRRLQSYSWPGNIRELFNTLERAAVCCPGRQITPADITFSGSFTNPATPAFDCGFRQAKQDVIVQFEHDYVEELLTKHHGNITQAALEAGKERRAFGKLVKKYGLMSRSA